MESPTSSLPFVWLAIHWMRETWTLKSRKPRFDFTRFLIFVINQEWPFGPHAVQASRRTVDLMRARPNRTVGESVFPAPLYTDRNPWKSCVIRVVQSIDSIGPVTFQSLGTSAGNA
ncbi:MAG TPA: hypothetical protein VF791_15950 [Pyrinomonadaceae bacterium]